MILRWYSGGNHGRYMMQIKCLSNGSYSLKSCHNPFGKGFQPPRPYGKIPVEHLKSLHGASLKDNTLFIKTEQKCRSLVKSETNTFHLKRSIKGFLRQTTMLQC